MTKALHAYVLLREIEAFWYAPFAMEAGRTVRTDLYNHQFDHQ